MWLEFATQEQSPATQQERHLCRTPTPDTEAAEAQPEALRHEADAGDERRETPATEDNTRA